MVGRDAAAQSVETASEAVLDVAASQGLLVQADTEKSDQPFGSEDEDGSAGERAAVEDEDVGGAEGADEHGQSGKAPERSGKEVAEMLAVNAINADPAALDARENQNGEGDGEKVYGVLRDGVAHSYIASLYPWRGLRGCGSRFGKEAFAFGEPYRDRKGERKDAEEQDEDCDSPTCAETETADERIGAVVNRC